jgi:predicted nuclease of predicted toxin-antitoxin system
VKFKLDENLGLSVARVLREAAHDVSTVYDQKLHGATDESIYDVCRREQRCLVTLDLDFGNVLRFPPEPTAGIVVLRPPGKALVSTLSALARQLAAGLKQENVSGRLWIIEAGRIRIHQAAEPND